MNTSFTAAWNSGGAFFGPNGRVFHRMRPMLVTIVRSFCMARLSNRWESPE